MEFVLFAGVGAGILVMLFTNRLAHWVYAKRYGRED